MSRDQEIREKKPLKARITGLFGATNFKIYSYVSMKMKILTGGQPENQHFKLDLPIQVKSDTE